jgi:hypothetical protein
MPTRTRQTAPRRLGPRQFYDLSRRQFGLNDRIDDGVPPCCGSYVDSMSSFRSTAALRLIARPFRARRSPKRVAVVTLTGATSVAQPVARSETPGRSAVAILYRRGRRGNRRQPPPFYRRWKTPEGLAREAASAATSTHPAVPDTGCLRWAPRQLACRLYPVTPGALYSCFR